MQVGAEFLVAKHGQAFLQRQLEPVAQGHPVARPVVEILVADHRLDVEVVGIGGAVRIGQDVAGVEDVEALVLHRAHVEIVGGNHVEHVEVVVATETLLVPAHRRQHRIQGMPAAWHVVLCGPDIDRHVATFGRGEAGTQAVKLTGHQREQVARLGMWIVPARPVAPVVQLAAFDGITVGQQLRVARRIGAQGDVVDAQHVRPIREKGDAAETFGLALRQQHAATGVQAFQPRVGRRMDAHAGLDHRGAVHGRQQQGARLQLVIFFTEPFAIDADRQQFQAFAIQP